MKLRTLAVVAALAAVAHGTSAYDFAGPRWATTEVPFFVNPVNADVSEDAATTALQVAAAAWSDQTDANVRLYYAGRTTGTSLGNNGVNEVFFRNESNGSQAAAAYYWYNSSQQIVDADIVIWDGGFKFFTGQSGCTNGQYLEDVATHEFGHFLGLRHSTDIAATMYATFSGSCGQSWRTLAPDDRAGIEALYPPVAPPPAAPASLAGSAVTGKINLVWLDKASNEDGIAIERSTNGGAFTALKQLPANATSYADTAISASTKYTYRARTWNAGGYSAYSNLATVNSLAAPLPAAPSSPTPASGATGQSTSLTLKWASASGATSYDVYFGKTSNPSLLRSVTGTSTSSGKLSTGTVYYWKVVAKNASGTTSGPVWTFTTAASAPKKPGNLR
jgi:hypothetical protein